MKKLLPIVAAAALAGFLSPAKVDAGTMMQGFYWDVPGGSWYDTMGTNANGLRYMTGGYGIDRMYYPPPSKGQGGGFTMGYDPADYKDVGNYNQHGWTETRFGSKSELTASTTEFRNRGVSTMADIVINHRSGGASEYNPNVGYNTYTDFQYQASGYALWHYNEFHPSAWEYSDPGAFGGYPDVAHASGTAYTDLVNWGNWLKNNSNAGFNGGWRFDFVKGIHPWMVKEFRYGTGYPLGIGEYWDANTSILDSWTSSADSSAFDFASYYTLKDICNNGGGGGYMPDLVNHNKSFAAKNPWRSVNFAGNHDTDEIGSDKMLAYAYLTTFQGYPSIWWKDYFDYGLANLGGQWGNGIKQLVWAREKLAGGGPNIQLMKTNDSDLMIYGDVDGNGTNPGYIVVLNDSSSNWRGSWVQTNNPNLRNRTLKCYAWYSPNGGQNYQPASKWSNSSGWVDVWAPPRGYAVYGPDGY